MAHGLKKLKKIDVDKTEIKTSYCISMEQREKQVLYALNKIKGRLSPVEQLQNEPIAVVCYGPSLKETWEKLKDFHRIMTCSGAHDFLIEKGIVPNWHVDLDPREHKALMVKPHKDVEYLMASCMHPKVWEKLEGFKVKLWHIYANETNKELPTKYPQGDWVFTGGNNVGLRCLVLARVLGFRDIHLFGMDYSFPKDCESHHAGEHINAPKDNIFEVPFDGKTYYCEAVHVDYCRQFFHEVDLLPDVSITLHGKGLLQHMVEKRKPAQKSRKAMLGWSTPVTFSKEQIEKYRKLHLDPLYGIDGKKKKDIILQLSESLDTRSILDYGCGKGTLAKSLPFPIWEYDPAIEGKSSVPKPADLVVCLNVLECIEPEYLENTLGDLVRVTDRILYTTIEGQREYWEPLLSRYFKIGKIFDGEELQCVLEPRKLEPIKE